MAISGAHRAAFLDVMSEILRRWRGLAEREADGGCQMSRKTKCKNLETPTATQRMALLANLASSARTRR